MCTVHRDTYVYVNLFFFMTIFAVSLVLCNKCLHTGLMVPSFLSLESPLSDSYTFIRTLTRLSMYMYYSRLLVYDIVNVSL